jgi:hypothetical protein
MLGYPEGIQLIREEETMDLTRRGQDWTTRRQGTDDPFSLMFQDLQRLAGNMRSSR